jgi:hypothetical protein
MTTRTIDGDALIELAIHTLKTDIAPVLPAEKRYAAAMIVNALEIARRSIAGESESARWEILDALYDDGEGSLAQLATDIRAGEIDADGTPDLHARLRKLVLAELAVNNPRFLKQRGAG